MLYKKIKHLEKEPEVKHFDSITTYTTIPNEVAIPILFSLPLNDPIQGLSVINRIGSEVMSKKLHIKLALRGQPLAVGDSRIRVIIFWYKGAQGTSPNSGEIFDLSIAPSTFAFRNMYFIDEYKMLYDKTFVLNPEEWNGTTTVIPDIRTFTKSFSLGRKIKYSPGAGTTPPAPADITLNALYFGICTSSAYGAANVNNPQFELSTRYAYTDC